MGGGSEIGNKAGNVARVPKQVVNPLTKNIPDGDEACG